MDFITFVKLLSLLVYPLGFALWLIVLSVVLRWLSLKFLSRILLSLGIMVLWIFSTPKVSVWLASGLEDQYPQQALAQIQKHDLIVVMGGGLKLPIKPAQHVQLTSSSDRYWHAARLFAADNADKILILGGNVFDQPGIQAESVYAKELLISWGVPADAILIDTVSRTTEQNAEQFKYIVKQLQESDSSDPINKVLVVTSALHMPRTLFWLNSQQLDISLNPASADVIVTDRYTPSLLSWLPNAGSMQLSTVALHEIYGLWFGRIKMALIR
ncbi:MAG: YdcF family protein [Pseudomonadota bacterium]